jgi:transposase
LTAWLLLVELHPKIMPRLTLEQRSDIVAKYEAGGYSGRLLAKLHQTTEFTVRSTIRRWRETGSLNYRSRIQNVKCTPVLRAQVKRMAKNKRFKSTRRVANALKAKGTSVSHMSVHRMLRTRGLRPYRRPPKPRQLPGDKARRLRWCRAERNRTWDNTWFADEKHFYLHPRPNRKNDIVWTDDPASVEPAGADKYAFRISVYGAFSKRGVSKLFTFTETNNGALMKKILNKTLIPAIKATEHDDDVWYLHDNDSKCQAKIVTSVLDANDIHRGRTGEFPARSPDFNPIENAWGTLASRVNELQPKDPHALRRAVVVAWRQVMTPEYRAALSDSMKSRIKAVLRARGAPTRY